MDPLYNTDSSSFKILYTLTDEKLYLLCRHYGEEARKWRQKFLGLLPEVYRRRLYEKKGFGSIFEFAFKLSGVSEEQVSRVLHLERKFEDTPILKDMLEKGEVSINKLSRIASVVTKENEEFWAAKVKILPQAALETLVRDSDPAMSYLQISSFGEEFVRTHKLEKNFQMLEEFHLSSEVSQKLLELQRKGIDVNQLLLEFLEKRDQELVQEKEKGAAEMSLEGVSAGKTNSRYIPVKVRKIIRKEYGTKCSLSHCLREAETIHHTQRFSLGRTHDPRFLAPLCKEHHQIAHSIDVKYQEYASFPRVTGRSVAPSRNLDSS